MTSFLSLRIAAGGLLQAIVLTISEQWDLRIGILRSRCNLDLDEPSVKGEGDARPKPKFAANVNVSLILGGAAVVLASSVVGGLAVGVRKAREAFV